MILIKSCNQLGNAIDYVSDKIAGYQINNNIRNKATRVTHLSTYVWH